MPVVTSTVSRPLSFCSSPAGPRAAMCSAAECRSSDLAEAEARWAARSVAQARTGAPDDDRQQEEERVAQRGQRPVVEEGTVDHSGDEPGLRDDQECRQAADDDGQDDEAPGCARVAQEPGVEGPAPPSRLRWHCRLRCCLGHRSPQLSVAGQGARTLPAGLHLDAAILTRTVPARQGPRTLDRFRRRTLGLAPLVNVASLLCERHSRHPSVPAVGYRFVTHLG